MERKALSRHLINILKLIFAIILLPVTFGASIGFYSQLKIIEKPLGQNFFLGIVSFLIIYLFFYEPINIHRKGQRFVYIIFKFFSPIVKVTSFCLPIYTILLLLILLLTNSILEKNYYNGFIIFMIGFSFIFHLVFTAKALRSKESFFAYASYIFFMEMVYIFNIFLVAFGFNYLIDNFSFISFYHQTFAVAGNIYMIVIGQMFFVN
jgi:hypothetical protein